MLGLPERAYLAKGTVLPLRKSKTPAPFGSIGFDLA